MNNTLQFDRICRPAALLAAALKQLSSLLDSVSDAMYVQKPVGVIESSIGGHVRHCLDHFESLCAAIVTGELDYDRRERGTSIESSRCAAIEAIEGLLLRVARINHDDLDRPLRLTAMLSGDGTTIEAGTTVGRELAFVLSHTIHHNAIVSAMCRTLGVPLPARFGYAPATIAHLEQTACVPSPSSR
ncbi:MAG: DinB family protein [Phycisphaerae bacterium]